MDRPTPAKVKGSPAGRVPSRRVAVTPAFVLLAALATTLVAACTEGRGAQDPSQQPPYDPNNPYAQPQGQNPYAQPQPNPYGQPYPQQGQPYPQQPQPYPQQGQPVPGPQPQPTAVAPASPLALPCQNDLICGTHKCNLQSQRCSFPCAANTDCASGFSCMGAGGPTAICVPGAGQ